MKGNSYRSFLYLLIAILALITGCNAPSQGDKGSTEKVTVKTIKVKAIEGQSIERVPGNVRPGLDSQLEAKVPARIIKYLVKEGDRVSEGQLLVELDSREIQAKLDQALASQKQAEADLKRYQQLLPAGAVTKQEFDAADAKAKIASASVAEAKAMLGYAQIAAPYAGVIAKKFSQEGDLASPGRPLLVLEKQDAFRFEADVPETLSSSLKIGKDFSISLTGESAEILGKLAEVSPTTDPNSRTLHIKIDLPTQIPFRSGQFGYVSVPIGEEKQIAIPSISITEKGQLEYVFVVNNNTAFLRLVRTGKRNQDTVEILSGLMLGDELVITNLNLLYDTAKVEVEK